MQEVEIFETKKIYELNNKPDSYPVTVFHYGESYQMKVKPGEIDHCDHGPFGRSMLFLKLDDHRIVPLLVKESVEELQRIKYAGNAK